MNGWTVSGGRAANVDVMSDERVVTRRTLSSDFVAPTTDISAVFHSQH